jgi:DNA-binding transcriptional ArsR family regulator
LKAIRDSKGGKMVAVCDVRKESADKIAAEFGISQPAVSQHLRVLRDSGFATVRPDGARRLYAVDTRPLEEVDAWVGQFRAFWAQRLDALGTEIARDRRERRHPSPRSTP